MYKIALFLLFAVLAVATAQYYSAGYYGNPLYRTGYVGGLYRSGIYGGHYSTPLAYNTYGTYGAYPYLG